MKQWRLERAAERTGETKGPENVEHGGGRMTGRRTQEAGRSGADPEEWGERN